MSSYLIINADDFGRSPEVNDAIERLLTEDRLQNVSILTNFPHSDDAVRLLHGRTNVSIGVHLNIVEGSALSPSNKCRAITTRNGEFVPLTRLFLRWLRKPKAVSVAVEYEWRAQIEHLLNSGVTVSHSDSHQHVHAFPPFWEILTRLCREYAIPAVRFPQETGLRAPRRLTGAALRVSAGLSRRFVGDPIVVTNDHFLGFANAGRYTEVALIADLSGLKDGVTELCVHPSLAAGRPYLSMNGAVELEALTGSRIWDHLADSNIALTTWAQLPQLRSQNTKE